MFSDELKKLLVQVITSWQVLVVTGVLVIYVFLVNFVARIHYRSKSFSMPKVKRKKSAEAAVPAPVSDSEELGLEEAQAPEE